jgi:hypothetical protein
VSSLPSTSPHRRPILSSLSTNIPTSTAANLFNVSPSSIKNARQPSYDPKSTELYTQYKHGVKRRRINEETRVATHEFIQSRCPVKSGSVRVLYKQYITDGELYRQYSEDFEQRLNSIRDGLGGEEVINKLNYKTFMKVKGEMKVSKQRTYWGQFDCPICIEKKKD